jgi:surfeit locus 1 family protein
VTKPAPGNRQGRSPALALVALLLVAGLVALGVWQVQRLAWKRDLIARVEARIHAPPVPFPTDWSSTDRARDEYRRVTLSGHFLNDRTTLVQAATIRGSGYWVMTPLATHNGTVMINRGFIPTRTTPYTKISDGVRFVGLIRMTEPGGGFLRNNDATTNRWYSRDVPAIAQARALPAPIAPWFVDAEQSGAPDTLPIGGLTVIRFPNNHLVYAITWFALAAMVAGAYIFVMRAQKPPRP